VNFFAVVVKVEQQNTGTGDMHAQASSATDDAMMGTSRRHLGSRRLPRKRTRKRNENNQVRISLSPSCFVYCVPFGLLQVNLDTTERKKNTIFQRRKYFFKEWTTKTLTASFAR
jgi:hypothetical protein